MLFFFSSRRRHTRCGRDWSSDVCSSDLLQLQSLGLSNCRFQEGDASDLSKLEDDSFDLVVSIFGAMFAPKPFDVAKEMRSEERRVGKECRSRWSPYH